MPARSCVSDSSGDDAEPSGEPPCTRSALTVATTTTAAGRMPPWRQTMSMNFCMPMSAPKPDSVTT